MEPSRKTINKPVPPETNSLPSAPCELGSDDAGGDVDKLLDIYQVCEIVGVSRASIYAWADLDLFPEPVRVGIRRTKWRMSDIRKWIKDRTHT
jgi:predicted DNA-binding transcriptional regulator AlpA